MFLPSLGGMPSPIHGPVLRERGGHGAGNRSKGRSGCLQNEASFPAGPSEAGPAAVLAAEFTGSVNVSG